MRKIKVLTLSHQPSSFVNEIVLSCVRNHPEIEMKYIAPLTEVNKIPVEEFNKLGIKFIPLSIKSKVLTPGIIQDKSYISSLKPDMVTFVLKAFYFIYREAKEVDIIHSHWVLPMGLIGGIIGKILGKRTLITVHGASVYYNPKAGFVLPQHSYIKFALLLTFSLTDRLIAISRDCIKHLRDRHAPLKKIKLIYNGVDHNFFRPMPENGKKVREYLGIPQQAPVILAVRNFSYRKGLHLLIRAMKEVVKSYPDAFLLLIGGGPYEPKLKELVNTLGLKNKVKFLGIIPNRELPPYYEAADIVVVPSYEEGFGIAAIEAMAMEKPLIATPAGGMAEVIDPSSTLIVPIGEWEPIAKAIISLIENPQLRENLGKKGRKRVEKYFTWERAGNEYVEVYKELCGFRKE